MSYLLPLRVASRIRLSNVIALADPLWVPIVALISSVEAFEAPDQEVLMLWVFI